MTTLFDDRERAAEYGYTHAEELRFLAARGGIEALGLWAAERIGLEEGAGYAAALVADMISGKTDVQILTRVRADLARAGVPEASAEAGPVLTRATADVSARLHGLPHLDGEAHRPAASTATPGQHHRNAFWGWDD